MPSEIKQFMVHHELQEVTIPSDPEEFGERWSIWWRSMQPSWRYRRRERESRRCPRLDCMCCSPLCNAFCTHCSSRLDLDVRQTPPSCSKTVSDPSSPMEMSYLQPRSTCIIPHSYLRHEKQHSGRPTKTKQFIPSVSSMDCQPIGRHASV